MLIDDTLCPLCQAKNQCGINQYGKKDNELCWCTKEKIPEALISQVPAESLHKSCICQACIQKFNLDNAKEVK